MSIISIFLHCRMWVVFSTFLMQQGNVLYFQIPMISIVVPVTRNLLYNLTYHIFEIRGRYFMTSLRPFQLVRPKAFFSCGLLRQQIFLSWAWWDSLLLHRRAYMWPSSIPYEKNILRLWFYSTGSIDYRLHKKGYNFSPSWQIMFLSGQAVKAKSLSSWY